MKESIIKVNAKTDIGKRRKNNEDAVSYLVPTKKELLKDYGCIFVVADGVGGNANGEIASKLACSFIIKSYYLQSQELSVDQRLKKAIEKANELIIKKALELKTPDMATTVTVAVILEKEVYIANVGDSRTYLINPNRKEVIKQITQDHSLVESQVRKGLLSKEDAEKAPNKNVITRAVGMDRIISIDLFKVPWMKGDKYFLTTDGLLRVVQDKTIAEAINKLKPNEAINSLVNIANDKGGPDNITVCLVQKEKPSMLPYYLVPSVLLVMLLFSIITYKILTIAIQPYPKLYIELVGKDQKVLSTGIGKINLRNQHGVVIFKQDSDNPITIEDKVSFMTLPKYVFKNSEKTPGTYTLSVRSGGYVEKNFEIHINDNKQVSISETLKQYLDTKDLDLKKDKDTEDSGYFILPVGGKKTSFKIPLDTCNTVLLRDITSNDKQLSGSAKEIQLKEEDKTTALALHWEPFIKSNGPTTATYKIYLYQLKDKNTNITKSDQFDLIVNETTTKTQFSLTPELYKDYNGFTYRWQVVALDTDGKEIPGSKSQPAFFVMPPLVPLKLIAPGDRAKNVTLPPTLKWEQVKGVKEYYLYFGSYIGKNSITDYANPDERFDGFWPKTIKSTEYTIQYELKNGIPFQWFVKSIHQSKNGKFTIISPEAGRFFTTKAFTQTPPTTPPPANTGTVQITSEPSGATITIDGKGYGKTPTKLTLAPGSYKTVLSLTGYRTETKDFTITKGESKSLAVILIKTTTPPLPNTNTKIVTITYPSGYQLTIDGDKPENIDSNSNTTSLVGKNIETLMLKNEKHLLRLENVRSRKWFWEKTIDVNQETSFIVNSTDIKITVSFKIKFNAGGVNFKLYKKNQMGEFVAYDNKILNFNVLELDQPFDLVDGTYKTIIIKKGYKSYDKIEFDLKAGQDPDLSMIPSSVNLENE
jgi:serine/threonine protein phosphatase PrpC